MAKPHSTASVSKRELLRIRAMAVQAEASRWRDGFDPCVYCGVIANSIDRIPPRSARPGIIATGLAMRYLFLEVPACCECNSVLGAHGLWTVRERREYIRKALQRRYAKMLHIPDWDDTELSHMSKGMQSYITNGLLVRDFVRQRIAFSRMAH